MSCESDQAVSGWQERVYPVGGEQFESLLNQSCCWSKKYSSKFFYWKFQLKVSIHETTQNAEQWVDSEMKRSDNNSQFTGSL